MNKTADEEVTLRDFHNRLRILRAIDLHELQEVGLFVGADSRAWDNDPWDHWVSFSGDPYAFFIRCSDDDAAKIWQVVERRAGTALAEGREP